MIFARIIKDSISWTGVRITTFELVYPRFILAEVNTHRSDSKNSSSSRAIPVAAMLEQIRNNPAVPVHWGKNQSGMQAKEELDEATKAIVQADWLTAMEFAVQYSERMQSNGLHKQVANRVTEPWQWMKTVYTTTSPANLFNLRHHEDAQPEFRVLAGCMLNALAESEPEHLYQGMWHLPYVDTEVIYDPKSKASGFYDMYQVCKDEFGNEIPLELALKISASCCAQVSYRKNDPSLEKAEVIYDRLINSKPCHASPVEHQALVPDMEYEPFDPSTWQDGWTHVRKDGTMCSGNFREWIQHRQLIPDNFTAD